MNCDQPDNRAADSRELAKLSEMIRAFGFHGLIMLSRPCPKCNRLHAWRLITTMPPDEGGLQDLLRGAADMMDEGTPEKFFDPIMQGSGPQ